MNVDDDPLMALLNGDAKHALTLASEAEPELTSSVNAETSSTSTTSIIAAVTPATMQEEG